MEDELLFKIEIPKESITSIENLAKANKALREERKKLDLQSEEGLKRAKEINKQLDENTAIIKENSSALEKQRLNVGNYTGALDKMVPGLGATANGFGAMTKTALAFIATPIGAVIGALGVALAALTSYFKGSEEGQTKFNKIMNVGAAVVGKFSDLIQFLGGFLFENLVKGGEKVIAFLNKFVPGFEEATNALEKFLNLDVAENISNLQEQEVALNRLLITERGRLRAAIEEAKLRAESTKDIKARGEALAEVEKLTNELFDKEARLAKLQNEILTENAKLANNTIEDNDAIAESIAKIDDIERQRAAALKENATKQLAISEQQRAATEKERGAIVDLSNAAILKEVQDQEIARLKEERHQRELEQINERIQAYVSEEQQLRNRIAALDLESDFADESAEANQQYNDEVLKGAKATQEANRNTQVFQTSLSSLTGVLKNQTAAQKALSSAQALINTYLGATNVLTAKPALPFPLNIIALAATIGSGLAAVAQINNAKFADGGLVGFAKGGLSGTRINSSHGKSIRRSNGDNLLATVKTGEVILNERQQAKLGGAATFRSIGVSGFASGGATSAIVNSAARSSENSLAQNQLLSEFIKKPFIVTVEDINAGIDRVAQVESRAQVI